MNLNISFIGGSNMIVHSLVDVY